MDPREELVSHSHEDPSSPSGGEEAVVKGVCFNTIPLYPAGAVRFVSMLIH